MIPGHDHSRRSRPWRNSPQVAPQWQSSPNVPLPRQERKVKPLPFKASPSRGKEKTVDGESRDPLVVMMAVLVFGAAGIFTLKFCLSWFVQHVFEIVSKLVTKFRYGADEFFDANPDYQAATRLGKRSQARWAAANEEATSKATVVEAEAKADKAVAEATKAKGEAAKVGSKGK